MDLLVLSENIVQAEETLKGIVKDKLTLQEDNDKMELLLRQIEERAQSLTTEGIDHTITECQRKIQVTKKQLDEQAEVDKAQKSLQELKAQLSSVSSEVREKTEEMEKSTHDEETIWRNVLQRYEQGLGECHRINEQLKKMISECDSSVKMLTKNAGYAEKMIGK
ncbi:uncharacterized protein MONOS_11259 [Monocercomonoides exilis]|uniref:uncharacterized protein n=1 Tax=Monocercomonoides exilis TaxID=2049356 RepID=UPI00355A893A|nr:hypothetical protein MONOS_11259 [Monocercomonoides exilis]|eukprot:MONOS_11259.1-p1 / transcript=MONOS_11259.1 / gene=MONOS_11259 / organism=Monocercomonoides_exilis_PA203 / gene_product=unspecified product / transcript_product=unspecified product / location=Mono_scaffold00555:11128-11716(-) / protein_length=165 / sequence_SO=supercontig / SO=protein_coding / is_pseudo=false